MESYEFKWMNRYILHHHLSAIMIFANMPCMFDYVKKSLKDTFEHYTEDQLSTAIDILTNSLPDVKNIEARAWLIDFIKSYRKSEDDGIIIL